MREVIGRYRVTGLLGEGGMGVVYSAHDSQLGRPVAIKMIKLQDLRAIDIGGAGRLGTFIASLIALLEGRTDDLLSNLRRLADLPDPEGRDFMGRTFAHVGAFDEALPILAEVVDNGFFCLTALTRDPWLDGLRGRPEFSAVVRRVEARHRHALISFLTAEGDRVLGIGHPV